MAKKPKIPVKILSICGSGVVTSSMVANKLVDLLEEEGLPEEPEELDWDGGAYDEEREEPELYVPAPRLRKSRRAAVAAELIATVSVVAAALAVILGMLAI